MSSFGLKRRPLAEKDAPRRYANVLNTVADEDAWEKVVEVNGRLAGWLKLAGVLRAKHWGLKSCRKNGTFRQAVHWRTGEMPSMLRVFKGCMMLDYASVIVSLARNK